MIRNKGFSPVKKREKTSEASYNSCRSSNEAAKPERTQRKSTWATWSTLEVLWCSSDPSLIYAKRKTTNPYPPGGVHHLPRFGWEWWGNLMVGDERSGRRLDTPLLPGQHSGSHDDHRSQRHHWPKHWCTDLPSCFCRGAFTASGPHISADHLQLCSVAPGN